MSLNTRITSFLKQAWLKDIVRFGLVGLVGTAVDLGLLNLLHLQVGWSLFWAVFWGFVLATLVVYTINNRWTYGHLGLPFQAQNLLKYATVAVIGLAITELLVHFLSVENALNYNLAKIIAIMIVFFWNFFANRFWTFRAKISD